ncbi:MAG: aminomethyl-transferring glycine dehydrogenase subunit GcvPA [Caldisphaeraceae archaeon]|nr:aminomethyl-transferring glycine dehydrogenase subunit GcvPA [Caldisphaeraceae archaeon]MEB3692584.1 aminomethyl-transferring glycine dehydrogenase subunit GcvPA [Caldisphaeraceae archaeon]MEB3797505.1 aminomethyl-transferring glycine dehydrogenase subunit GcvPA [Caldisphaeraceae archaeon]
MAIGVRHAWIPNSKEEIKREMLDFIGVKDVLDLYNDVPEDILISEDKWNSLNIGMKRPLDEIEVSEIIEDILNKNIVFGPRKQFIGGGAWPHYIPASVRYLAERGEFLTAYTPYQAEINQGLMQTLFEYQSMMADLLDMDVVNSSMYDMASSLGEVILMAARIKKKNKVIVPEVINPFHLSVARSYSAPHGIQLKKYKIDKETGYLDVEDVKNEIDDNTIAVYLEYPYQFTGVVDINAKALGEIAHEKQALFIVGVNPISLMLYKPPGELDADIAIGEGQPLGLGLNFGGPYLGIFATKWKNELVRQMPGRIIGLTEDSSSSNAYAMVLQTREQHIRRSKATSNITTNSSLNAMIAAFYVALLGRKGLRDVAEAIWYRSHYASRELKKIGLDSPLFTGEFFGDFIVDFKKDFKEIRKSMLKQGILLGIPLANYVEWARESWGLLSFTEVHHKEDIDFVLDKIREFM